MNTEQVKILSVNEEVTAWVRTITLEKDGEEILVTLRWDETEGLNYTFWNDEDEERLFPDEFEGDIAFLLDELTADFTAEEGESEERVKHLV